MCGPYRTTPVSSRVQAHSHRHLWRGPGSVLAASDPITQQSIAGVIGIGLPDRNELGWRWKDSIIYLTHGAERADLQRRAIRQ